MEKLAFTRPGSSTLKGAYLRKQGRQRVYTYEGVHGVTEAGVWWLVTVRFGDVFKGAPSGLVGTRAASIADITALVHRQIEDLDQIEE
jgi:hypothetical protein